MSLKDHLGYLMVQRLHKIVCGDNSLDPVKKAGIFNKPGKKQPLRLPVSLVFILFGTAFCLRLFLIITPSRSSRTGAQPASQLVYQTL